MEVPIFCRLCSNITSDKLEMGSCYGVAVKHVFSPYFTTFESFQNTIFTNFKNKFKLFSYFSLKK